MNIDIKLEKNYEIIAKLNKYVHEIHFKNHPKIFLEYNFEIMLPKIKEYLNDNNKNSLIVYNNDNPIGYAIFYKRNYPDHLFKKEHCSVYIDQMCVIKKLQNKGIGSKIIDFIKKYCNQNQINRIELSVWSDNNSAKNFYKKMGFENYLENMKIDLQ